MIETVLFLFEIAPGPNRAICRNGGIIEHYGFVGAFLNIYNIIK